MSRHFGHIIIMIIMKHVFCMTSIPSWNLSWYIFYSLFKQYLFVLCSVCHGMCRLSSRLLSHFFLNKTCSSKNQPTTDTWNPAMPKPRLVHLCLDSTLAMEELMSCWMSHSETWQKMHLVKIAEIHRNSRLLAKKQGQSAIVCKSVWAGWWSWV